MLVFNPWWWIEFNAALTLLTMRRLRCAASLARWEALPKCEVVEIGARRRA